MRVALVGGMGSGKSTLARAFIALDNDNWRRVGLADPVKRIAVDMLNGTYDLTAMRSGLTAKEPEVTLAEVESNKEHFRMLLQWLGTDYVRDYLGLKEMWIELFGKEVDKYAPFVNLVSDDVRFLNEAEALRSNGFVIVKVNRPWSERYKYLLTKYGTPTAVDAAMDHPSETELEQIVPDIEIANTIRPDLVVNAALREIGLLPLRQ